MPDGEYGTLVPFKEEACQHLRADETACTEPAIYRCHKCSLLYCLDHASEVDPQRFCLNCLKVEDAVIEETPLVDAEGVRHNGRVLRPIGSAFLTEEKMIYEMTEDELKVYITHYKILVREAAQLKEFREINLAQAQHALLDKGIKTLVDAGGNVTFPSRPKAVPKPVKQKPNVIDTLADRLKRAGITPEMLQAIIDSKKARSA